MSSGSVLDSMLNYNGTSFEYIFEDDVQYCQIITINVTAVSSLGLSVPGSVSRGFPIGETKFITCNDLLLCFNQYHNHSFVFVCY